MWNEAGVAVGGEGGHVVHVGRSWFRMTPTAPTAVADGDGDGIAQPASATKTARIGLGRPEVLEAAPVTPPRPVEWDAVAPRGTVTVSWWLLGVLRDGAAGDRRRGHRRHAATADRAGDGAGCSRAVRRCRHRQP